MINTKNKLVLRAALPPPSDPSVAKKNVSLRLELPYVESLESMARALGKSPSGLGAEIMEAAIDEFSNNLGELRPDLLRSLTRQEVEDLEHVAAYTDDFEPSFLPRPTWETPQLIKARLEGSRPPAGPVSDPGEED
jgi:hypothetical protein